MLWPSNREYQEAIQEPQRAFQDLELQGGQPEMMSATNSLQSSLPKGRAGNFAIAFRMECGSRSWAVKCFTRAPPLDLQDRYQKIGDHLARTRLPYTVGFTFLPQGIRVRSQWLPILKMEWIFGDSLVKYIEQNLGNPRALLELADRWKELVRALARAGISHGDLQHGNVLVIGGRLRLIDYDGMFVPALAGCPSHEKGHINYQHPGRDKEFGPGLDNFSGWVIYLSILAVAHEPKLWAEFKGGDDCLLFRKRDFLERDRSGLVQALRCSRQRKIRVLASRFLTVLECSPQQIPSLKGRRVRSAPMPVAPQPSLIALPDPGRPRRVAALAILGAGIACVVTVLLSRTARTPGASDAMERVDVSVDTSVDASVDASVPDDAAPRMQSAVISSGGAGLFESASRTGVPSPSRGAGSGVSPPRARSTAMQVPSLQQVWEEYMSNDFNAALVHGEARYRAAGDYVALEAAVLAACKLPQASKARAYYAKLPEHSRDNVRLVCKNAGIFPMESP